MKKFTTLACCFFVSFITFGQAGTLDPTFGNNGLSLYVTNHKSEGEFNDIALQIDGKIVAAGEEYFSTQVYNAIIVRYKTDGTPDSTFGVNGFADASTGARYKYNNAMVVKVLSDGKILALINAEGSFSDNPDNILIRFNADGSRDNTFGQNGMVIKDIGIDYAWAMQIQPDGKILFGGSINSIAFLARCNADGTNDASFGNNGLVQGSSISRSGITAIALTSNGKILVGGDGYRDSDNSHHKSVIIRYNTNGKVDSSFGVNGEVARRASAYSYTLTSLLIMPGDAFLASYFLFHNTQFYSRDVVSKYKANGSPDSTFGHEGTLISGVPENYLSYRTTEMALQQDGKIILAGQFMNKNADYAISVTRLLPGGQKDNSFGSHGTALTLQNSSKTNAVVIQSDGKIVVAGRVQTKEDTKIKLSLARYLPGGSVVAQMTTGRIAAVKKLTLFPNPAKDVLHISGLNDLSETSLTVVNIQGNIIKKISVNAGTYNLNVSQLTKGVYYLKVESGEQNNTYQFIKE